MTGRNDFDHQPVLFSALLTPHRSLNRQGFIVLMVLFGGVSFAAGIAFTMIGAWPVFGFFGLDLVLIYFAFRMNFREAAATEEIHVTPSEMRVRRISHRGHRIEWLLNPLWVKLDQSADDEFGIEKLYLVSRGRRIAIAAFLGSDEKARLSSALRVALQAAKRGHGFDPVPAIAVGKRVGSAPRDT